ncbi:MAG: PAS domain-containing protein [Alphaproteobacteria bacterium]|nr:MAG: PAS domain-containing protein [Alphaproteobacteria bacterium]
MIQDALQIGDDRPALQAPFQEQILDHWHQIRKGRHFPDKRDFRPQKFPKFLPQLAIVSVAEGSAYEDRLTGTTVSEVLRLGSGARRLVAPADLQVRETVALILDTASRADRPMYFRGIFTPARDAAIDFTVLVLPFSHNGDADVLDTLLLAFDFGRSPFIASFAPQPRTA